MDLATQHTRVLGNANLAARTINSGKPMMVCGRLVTIGVTEAIVRGTGTTSPKYQDATLQ